MFLGIHEGETQTDMRVLRRPVHQSPSHQTKWGSVQTYPTKSERTGCLRGVGSNRESGNDISLKWLQEIGAWFYGCPSEANDPFFDAETQMHIWNKRYGVDLIEVIIH